MDAREFLKIFRHECGIESRRGCCEEGNECPFWDKKEYHCVLDFDYYGTLDPVAIAESIKRKAEMPTPEEKPKYFTGKMFCIKSVSCLWTKGKVYNINNGSFYDDDEDVKYNGYESIEQINNDFDSQFALLIEPSIPADQPQLPEKITQSFARSDLAEDALITGFNALIDYLAAKERNNE